MLIKGQFKPTAPISPQLVALINSLGATERLARDVSKIGVQFGIEGEFYTQEETETALTPLRPPSSQPSMNLEWYVTDDGTAITHRIDAETVLHAEKWLHYLIVRILQPNGVTINGVVEFVEHGETTFKIQVKDNNIQMILN